MMESVSIDDIRLLKMISDPQFSPTGDQVAFVVTTINSSLNEYNSNIWLADIQTGAIRSFTSGRGKDKYPRWSPDGSTLLFLSIPLKTRWQEKTQLFTIPVFGGEAIQLTDLQFGVESPRWSPNSRQILFTSLTQETETPDTDVKIIRRIAYRINEKGYFEGKRNHLFTITPSNPNPTQITQGTYDVESPDWVDNDHIAFISNLAADADLTRDKYIYSVSGTNSEPIQITQSKQVISVLEVAPNGDEIAYLGHDYRFGLATLQDLWVVSLDGEGTTNLTKTFDYDIGNSVVCDTRVETPNCNPKWSSDSNDIFFTLVRSGITSLYKLSRDTLTLQKILGRVDHSIEAWSQSNNGIIAYTILTTKAPIELWVFKNQQEIQFSSMNCDWINQHMISGWESFSYQSSGGHTVDGWIIPPPNFQQDAKYPLLLEIHGGPRGVYGYSFMHEFQVLAAQGWIVMFVNPYGSGGYTQDFQSQLPGHYGERDYQDLMEAIDYAIQNFPYIDANRLGVLGGSYGGFMTNWVITHTQRFNAAVTMRGISNWSSMFGCSDIGWTFVRREMGDTLPWKNEELYQSKSPIRYVANVRTPTLIIHSEEDYRCPIEQAEQFFSALKYHGIPTELIRFPKENHNLSRSGKPRHREERLKHIVRWFKTYL